MPYQQIHIDPDKLTGFKPTGDVVTDLVHAAIISNPAVTRKKAKRYLWILTADAQLSGFKYKCLVWATTRQMALDVAQIKCPHMFDRAAYRPVEIVNLSRSAQQQDHVVMSTEDLRQ